MVENAKAIRGFMKKVFPSKNSFRTFLFFQICILFLLFIRFYYREEAVSLEFIEESIPISTSENLISSYDVIITSDSSASIVNVNQNRVEFVTRESTSTSESTTTSSDVNKLFVTIRLFSSDNKILEDLKGTNEGRDVIFAGKEKSLSNNYEGEGSMKLECEAKFPVEWSYSGSGIPNIKSIKSARSFETLQDSQTYTFHTILDFGRQELQEYDTGKYSCGSISSNMNTNVSTSSHIYLFVPGSDVILNPKEDGDTIKKITYNEATDGAYLVIPCAISNPNITLHLYKEKTLLEVSKDITFDPKIGFRMNLHSIKNPWGNYTCQFQSTNGLKISAFVLMKPYEVANFKEKVKVEPNMTSVIIKGSIPTLFECQANEEVLISFPSEVQKPIVAYQSEEMDRVTDEDSKYKYKASFIATPWQQGTSARDTNLPAVFQCKKKADGTLLHVWEYSDPGNAQSTPEVELTFSNFTNQFICCSNRRSERLLKITPCASIPECVIKSKSTNQSKVPHLSLKVENNCTKLRPIHSIPYGLVQCFAESSEDLLLFYSSTNDQGLTSINVLPNDNDAGDLLTLLQITTGSDPHRRKKGTFFNNPYSTSLECKGSSFYFSEGFVWSYQVNHGEVKEIVGDGNNIDGAITSLSEEYLPPFYYKRIIVSMDKITRNVTLFCNAPLATSSEWITAQFLIFQENIL